MKKYFTGIILIIFSYISVYAQPSFVNSYPDTLNKSRLTKIVVAEIITYSAELAFLSFIWYKDQKRVPFHFYNDMKGYFQLDKAGHIYGAYRESYAAYYALRQSGLNKKQSLIYGGPVGLILQTPIEIFDGLFEGWGFSWGDMIANAIGPAIFVAQEALFDNQVVLLKFSYSPSGYPKYHPILGENELESFFFDYNGHTYWLSANLKSIIPFNKMPSWLNFAFGYSGNGMIKEFENPVTYQGQPFPKLDRYRQYVFSLDIDFSKVQARRKWIKNVLRTVNLIKIPFPAIELNNIDGIRFHPVYF